MYKKGTKLLLAYKEYILEFKSSSSRSELSCNSCLLLSVAKLV